MWFIPRRVPCSLTRCTHMQTMKSGQSPGLDAASDLCALGETEGSVVLGFIFLTRTGVNFEPRSDINKRPFASRTHCWCTLGFCNEILTFSLKAAFLVLSQHLVTSPLFLFQFIARVVVEHWNMLSEKILIFFVFTVVEASAASAAPCLQNHPIGPPWEVWTVLRGLRGWNDVQVQNKKATSEMPLIFRKIPLQPKELFIFTYHNIILIIMFILQTTGTKKFLVYILFITIFSCV